MVDIIKELEQLGILGFFIFTRNARPIYLRAFSDHLPPITDESSYELSALIASMIQISEQLLSDPNSRTLLRDVALHMFRMYIDYWDQLIFVLVYDEPSYLDFRTSDILSLMKGTISLVKDSFQVFLAEEPEFNVAEIHIALAESKEFNNFKQIIDKVIHESYFKMLDSLNLPPPLSYQFYKNKKSL